MHHPYQSPEIFPMSLNCLVSCDGGDPHVVSFPGWDSRPASGPVTILVPAGNRMKSKIESMDRRWFLKSSPSGVAGAEMVSNGRNLFGGGKIAAREEESGSSLPPRVQSSGADSRIKLPFWVSSRLRSLS